MRGLLTEDIALPELVTGKTKALFDRPAVRDLYDIRRIQTARLPEMMAAGDAGRYRLHRRVRLYCASLSMPFPCPVDGRLVEKFMGRTADVESDLYPVLNAKDRPTLDDMMREAATYLDATSRQGMTRNTSTCGGSTKSRDTPPS